MGAYSELEELPKRETKLASMILHREWDEGSLETLAGFIVELPDLASKCVEFLVHLSIHLNSLSRSFERLRERV